VLTSHINHAKTSSDRTQNRFERLSGKIERLGEIDELKEKKKLK